MGWHDIGLLLAAGIVGGLTGSIAGLASVATYPALLVVGLPPVAANVTNTVALVFNGIGAVLGSRPELRGQRGWIRRIAPAAALGGAAGAVLLLSTPAEGFEKAVPLLLGASAVVILLPRRSAPAHPEARPHAGLGELAAILLICVYGGYFGAAAGVVLLALMLAKGSDTLAHANAGKNVVSGVANAVAALIFAVFAPVNWLAVVPLGLGCLLGSRLGPVLVRRLPATPLRWLIGAAGLGLAVELGIDAYT